MLVTLLASAGGVDIDAAAAKDVNIAGGQVALVSKDNAASAISLTANVGTSETITTNNFSNGSDGAGAVPPDAAAGGIALAWNDAKDLWAEGGRVKITADIAAEDAVVIDASAGGINISSIGTHDIDVTNTGGSVNISATEDVADASNKCQRRY